MGDDEYSVLIIDLFRHEPEADYVINGFPNFELAKEFARRWVRDSVEEQRKPGQSGEDLRRMWHTFGEDASVLDGEPHYAGSHELDYFVEHPATPEERDWQAIKKLAGLS
ncbi:MAG: hypothetical protein ABW208_22400 [Pyrinomonadaceae bacterium]